MKSRIPTLFSSMFSFGKVYYLVSLSQYFQKSISRYLSIGGDFATSGKLIFPVHFCDRKGPRSCRFGGQFGCLNRATLFLRESSIIRLWAECVSPKITAAAFQEWEESIRVCSFIPSWKNWGCLQVNYELGKPIFELSAWETKWGIDMLRSC